MARLWMIIGVVGLLICVAGCVDDRPIYAAPKLAPTESVTLRAGMGTYIEEVDGERVSDATIMMSNFGGDVVTVTPGTHDLNVVSNYNGALIHQTAHQFSFRCEPGHLYDFTPDSLFKPNVLRVTDKNTGQTLVIEDQDGSGVSIMIGFH